VALEVERRVSPESGTAPPGLGFSNSIAQRATVSPLSLAAARIALVAAMTPVSAPV